MKHHLYLYIFCQLLLLNLKFQEHLYRSLFKNKTNIILHIQRYITIEIGKVLLLHIIITLLLGNAVLQCQ